MKKANIILIILIVVLVIFLGVGLYFMFIKDDKEPQVIPPTNNEVIEEEPDEDGVDIIPNENDTNYEEHCLDNLCIKIGDFNLVEDYGGFSLTITNKGSETIASGFKNIIFSTPNGDIKLFFNHPELEPLKSIETEMTFENKDLIDAVDYRLEEPSAIEIMEYSQNMVN